MASFMRLKGKKKIFAIVFTVVTCVAILLFTVLFMPININVNWDKINPVETNVVKLSSSNDKNATGSTALVKLNADGSLDTSDWKVLQFTDLHFCERAEDTTMTLDNFVTAIQSEKPDLVVITGDAITSTQNRIRAIQFANVMERLGIYWAYCLGNHEGDNGARCLARKDIMDLFADAKYPHCLVENETQYTSEGKEVWGNGNYVLNLLGENYKPVQSLIFMDSGDAISTENYNKLVKDGKLSADVDVDDCYDYLKESQITWYTEQVNKITENHTNGVKSMVYIHIPLVEQSNCLYFSAGDTIPNGWAVKEELIVNGVKKGSVAVNEAEGWKLVAGSANYEGCCCSEYNSGMYDAMVASASTQAIFCGHDHIDNSIIYNEAHEGIYLIYNQSGGYATYTMYNRGKAESVAENQQGYSIVTIHADGTFDMSNCKYGVDFSGTPYKKADLLENSAPISD